MGYEYVCDFCNRTITDEMRIGGIHYTRHSDGAERACCGDCMGPDTDELEMSNPLPTDAEWPARVLEAQRMVGWPWRDFFQEVYKYPGGIHQFAARYGCKCVGDALWDNWTDGSVEEVYEARDGELYHFSGSSYTFGYTHEYLEEHSYFVRWILEKAIGRTPTHTNPIKREDVYDYKSLSKIHKAMLFARGPVHYKGKGNYFGKDCKSIREYYEKSVAFYEDDKKDWPTIESFVAILRDCMTRQIGYYADPKVREWVQQWIDVYEKEAAE